MLEFCIELRHALTRRSIKRRRQNRVDEAFDSSGDHRCAEAGSDHGMFGVTLSNHAWMG